MLVTVILCILIGIAIRLVRGTVLHLALVDGVTVILAGFHAFHHGEGVLGTLIYMVAAAFSPYIGWILGDLLLG